MPLPGTIHGPGDPFAATEWSVVLAAGSDAAPKTAEAALAQLCQIYWAPLYTFVRSRGHAMHDAQDLTQGFFAYLIEHRIYAGVDPRKGKFRAFLLASLKHFLADSRDRGVAVKRGGAHALLPLDEDQAREAESLFQTHSALAHVTAEDVVFERSWAEKLIATALARLSADYAAEGKTELFQDLARFLTAGADPLPTYDDLAARLQIPLSTLRSHVSRLRARYREALRREVRRTVATESEVDAELRELLRVLTT